MDMSKRIYLVIRSNYNESSVLAAFTEKFEAERFEAALTVGNTSCNVIQQDPCDFIYIEEHFDGVPFDYLEKHAFCVRKLKKPDKHHTYGNYYYLGDCITRPEMFEQVKENGESYEVVVAAKNDQEADKIGTQLIEKYKIELLERFKSDHGIE